MDHAPDPVRITRRTLLRRALRASAAAALVVPVAACNVLAEDDPTEGGLSFLGEATPTPSPTPATPAPTDAPNSPTATEGAPSGPPVVTLSLIHI